MDVLAILVEILANSGFSLALTICRMKNRSRDGNRATDLLQLFSNREARPELGSFYHHCR